jgi:hypothetical protein
MSETTQFQLADLDAAARLAIHLRQRWAVCVFMRGELTVVAATLRRERADLAFLLRTVERWLIDESLGPIAFELDDRLYLLEGQREIAAAA